ncbi:toxic anion resistance protein [Halomonas sp. 86]|uniref:toxic anion resistance protein n=1 Tax=unclassified Halomonas TaxID=2609666 RepID=UPI004033DEA5
MSSTYESTDAYTVRLEELRHQVIPALFENPIRMGTYGVSDDNSNATNDISDLMQEGSVGKLSAAIQQMVSMLSDADPKKIAKPSRPLVGWFNGFLGRDMEKQLRYEKAQTSLEDALKDARVVADRVEEVLDKIDTLIGQHDVQAEHLKVHIEAGKRYLKETENTHPDPSGGMNFDRPRERFQRKLTNLAALQSSHEMGLYQLKLTRAQAVDMLDRFQQTSTVLIPVWRQHTLSLVTTEHMTPEMMARANHAHEALMKSLSMSLNATENK